MGTRWMGCGVLYSFVQERKSDFGVGEYVVDWCLIVIS